MQGRALGWTSEIQGLPTSLRWRVWGGEWWPRAVWGRGRASISTLVGQCSLAQAMGTVPMALECHSQTGERLPPCAQALLKVQK